MRRFRPALAWCAAVVLWTPFNAATAPTADTLPRKTVSAAASANAPVADSGTIAGPTADSTDDSLFFADDSASTKTLDTAKKQLPLVVDTTKDSLKNAIHFDSCMMIGAGIGLSIGNIPIISLWGSGLPQSLADLGLSASTLSQPTDSAQLAYTLNENPDAYNMVFPISISIDRCYAHNRFGAGLTFSMVSKNYTASVAPGDSSQRSITVRQSLALYALSIDLLYGRAIPPRYFSVDGIDRTDAILGLSFMPLLALTKNSSVQSNSSDTRFSALADTIGKGLESFSAYGVAFGWRAGIMTLRRVSKQGGIEAGICYYGVWYGQLRVSGAPLYENQISKTGANIQETGTVSHHLELTVSLVRKVF